MPRSRRVRARLLPPRWLFREPPRRLPAHGRPPPQRELPAIPPFRRRLSRPFHLVWERPPPNHPAVREPHHRRCRVFRLGPVPRRRSRRVPRRCHRPLCPRLGRAPRLPWRNRPVQPAHLHLPCPPFHRVPASPLRNRQPAQAPPRVLRPLLQRARPPPENRREQRVLPRRLFPPFRPLGSSLRASRVLPPRPFPLFRPLASSLRASRVRPRLRYPRFRRRESNRPVPPPPWHSRFLRRRESSRLLPPVHPRPRCRRFLRRQESSPRPAEPRPRHRRRLHFSRQVSPHRSRSAPPKLPRWRLRKSQPRLRRRWPRFPLHKPSNPRRSLASFPRWPRLFLRSHPR